MYTVAELPIKNRLRTVDHTLTLEDALRAMFDREFTQIGVERDGELVGVVTYRSVVRTLLVLHELDVSDRSLDKISVAAATDEVETVSEDMDVLTVFDHLAENTYLVVDRDDEWRILTDFDLLTLLRESVEPFLLIESVETNIRQLFTEVFENPSEMLRETFDDDHPLPTPASVEHCSFGHYSQFISIHWDEFDSVFDEDRDIVRELIQEIGDMRNQLFHFRIDDTAEFNLDLLRFGHAYFASV